MVPVRVENSVSNHVTRETRGVLKTSFWKFLEAPCFEHGASFLSAPQI
jgi:hypothetical protein